MVLALAGEFVSKNLDYVTFLGLAVIVGVMLVIVAMLFIADYIQSLSKFVK